MPGLLGGDMMDALHKLLPRYSPVECGCEPASFGRFVTVKELQKVIELILDDEQEVLYELRRLHAFLS